MKKVTFLFILLIALHANAQISFLGKIDNSPVANRLVVTPITASIAYQGYDETQAYFGQGEYEIFLDNTNGILDKPIIILDGFDPGDSRNIDGLYNSLSFGGENLADILRDEGFDIVILNAPQYTTDGKDIDGGADYIQRNAMVLVELINFINTDKIGEEQLVILGPSMGGLIARYGLTYMESNALDADTRLYISFDAPHRGANVPISLQYLINYLAQQTGDPDAQAVLDQLLDSPAAKEMLYDHLYAHLLTDSTFEQDPTKLLPDGAPNFRDAFQAELDALGFPQQTRNVAMVNGSGLGTAIGSPGVLVVDTTLDLGSGATANVNLHFTPPASQNINVTSFDSFFVGIPIGSFDANSQSFDFTDGIDAAPGGISQISNAVGDGSGNPIIQDFVDALQQDDFSFIPLISSLAIEGENNWFATPNLDNSPFAASFIPDVNEPHVSVTNASAQFALAEIRNGVLGTSDLSVIEKYTLVTNPVKDIIKIQAKNNSINSNLKIKIISITGQTVYSKNIENVSQQFSLNTQLQTGTYFVRITDADGDHILRLMVD